MAERVAIVGGRAEVLAKANATEWARRVVRDVVRSLPPGSVVVTGDASGVDAFARHEARAAGLVVVVCEAPWGMQGPAAGPIRNSVVVGIADRGVALHVDDSRGTADTIRKFERAGKPVEVIEP